MKSAIEHGYFGADAYIDNRTDTLVVRGAAPQPKKPAQAPTPKAHPAAEDEYAALLRQLREVNDAIPDPVMSQNTPSTAAIASHSACTCTAGEPASGAVSGW